MALWEERGLRWGVSCCLNDACTYQRHQIQGRTERGRFVHLSAFGGAKGYVKALSGRCIQQTGNNALYSAIYDLNAEERSVERRRGGQVLERALRGEMKDTIQNKLSSADVDVRHPVNRNKWDCFYLNLTCCYRKALSILHSLSLCFSLTSAHCVYY